MAGKICVLTIAGSDSGGGAGIQSDVKTFRNHGVYGTTVITSVTAQNTKGVQSSFELPAKIIDGQLKSIFDDFNIKAVKTGMLSGSKVIDIIVKHLKRHRIIKLIVDPVILSKNNYTLLSKPGIKALREKLMPLTYLLTPNIPEAEILTGMKIETAEDLEIAAVMLGDMGAKNVLIKGGHMKDAIGFPKGTDILFDGKRFYMFNADYVSTKNTHGIGCTLSAAITSNLALGNTLLHSVESAKRYVSKLLRKSLEVGKGYNPVEQ